MVVDVVEVVRTCHEVVATVSERPDLRHTSHLLVVVGGRTVFDEHLRGPAVAPVFSVTKSVVATIAAAAVADGHLHDLDEPVHAALGLPPGTCRGQTVRHLLTMTRGAAVDPPYDLDTLLTLERNWLGRITAAPSRRPPGTAFCYDDGGVHLLAAILTRRLGRPLDEYAAERLFEPLGITEWSWDRDPDGTTIGPHGLALDATALAALGQLWNHGGVHGATRPLDADFCRSMTQVQVPGGPPERRPYGYLVWIDPDGWFAGGWAGQHVTCWPATQTVIVTTGDPCHDPGPPPRHDLHPTWRPARDLATERLRPLLT